METRGKFIVFEGTDGCGKTTQMKLLSEALQKRGIPVSLTREPTYSPIGMLLRKCLSREIETDERAIAALFAADRLDHIAWIEGELQKGSNVLCDRYYFSSLAYNGGIVSYDWVLELNRPAMETLAPDLVIYLDVAPEEGMRRVGSRDSTERYERLELQRRIRDTFLYTFARLEDQPVAFIPSDVSVGETHQRVLSEVLKLLGEN